MIKQELRVAKIIYNGILNYLIEIHYDCEKCKFRMEDNGLKCGLFGSSVMRFGKITRTEGCRIGFGEGK